MNSFANLSRALAALGPRYYARGWVLGTSGNFSAVVGRDPLQLAITASSVDKGRLAATHILRVNQQGEIIRARPRPLPSPHRRRAPTYESRVPSHHDRLSPSAETLLHLEIVRRRGAGAVLHTHSVWSTMLSDVHFARGGVLLAGYEMLKGLQGVSTHEHREWVPIVENDQNMERLSRKVGDTLDRENGVHALLLHRHGLYTWGDSLADAERHVEILEFLFETIGRTAAFNAREGGHGAAENP